MNPARAPQPRQRRYSARHQARLDAEAHAKLEELARTFNRKRGRILRYVMQWGLSYSEGWTIDQAIPASTQPVPVLLEPDVLQEMRDAAAARGVSTAAWLREAVRRMTAEDVPASWRAGETRPRSHDSGHYGHRFMLRLDDETSNKLETLTQAFGRPAAEVIRQLITQARPEDFPPSWHLAVAERQRRAVQPPGRPE